MNSSIHQFAEEGVRKDAVVRTTSLGVVRYERTLFKNVKTGVSCYLLDQLMQLDKHTRITEDAGVQSLWKRREVSGKISGIRGIGAAGSAQHWQC